MYIAERCDVGAAKWLKELLSVHKSYIISVSECQELMEQIHKILETRTQHYSSVFQLVGKLDMLDKQLRDKVEASNAGDSKEQEPLLLYQDLMCHEYYLNVLCKTWTLWTFLGQNFPLLTFKTRLQPLVAWSRFYSFLL